MWDVARLALLFTTNAGLLSESGTWTNPHTERQPKIWPSYTDDIKHLSALALYLSYANEMKQSLSPSQELFFFLSLSHLFALEGTVVLTWVLVSHTTSDFDKRISLFVRKGGGLFCSQMFGRFQQCSCIKSFYSWVCSPLAYVLSLGVT